MRKLPLVTPRSSVEIHGVYGQSVLELHEQIRRLLLQDTKDPAVAQFFAEPQINALRGEISWYTDADGQIVPFSVLSTADQDVLWQRLQTIRDRVKAVGEKYAARGGQTASTRIDTFRSMLSATSLEQTVFSVGGEPVICEWGCTPLGEGARPTDLWTLGAFREEAKAPETEAVEPKFVPPERHPEEPKPLKPEPKKAEVPVSQTEPAKHEPEHEPEKPKAPLPPPKKESVREKPVAPPSRPEPPREVVFNAQHRPLALPVSRGSGWRLSWEWLWRQLKYLILFFLALLLLGALLRGCSASPAVVATWDDRLNEESRLRAEIGQLRQNVSAQASQCAAPNKASSGNHSPSSSGSTINQRVEREGRTMAGDRSIALKWNGTHDLDLYVREPSGQMTGFGVPPQRISESGGHIDLDMNYSNNPASMSEEPVEVIKWKSAPPVGEYQVGVRLFRATQAEIPASQEIPYHLVVEGQGQKLSDKTGTIPVSVDCKSLSKDCKVTAITSFDFK